ncbi:hypothetical protein [Amaricoccus sp.]|uniref:hypothetical protein n=1 Tax=Amaricoccus sp. TaxID=1872485 RepID=UPI0026049E30|nr:hypothetical protein [Amaricoccus sp.]HRO12302.1 hypothetical protein [Amaricoccus sp.]
MQKNQLIAVAGGALLFLLGLVIGISVAGPDEMAIEEAVAGRVDAAVAAQNQRLDKLEASVATLSGELGGRLEGLGGTVDAGARTMDEIGSRLGDVGTRLGDSLADLGQSLAGAIEDSKAASLAALESGLAGLRGQISSPAAPAAEDAPTAATPADPGTPPEGLSAGETALLSDGALRVFVSRVDDAAGEASLRANGQDFALAVGDAATVASAAGDCRLSLDAVDRGHASVSGACGDALPAPDGAAPGTTVDLAEGLRVFVSGVGDDGARLAINGVATQTVPLGQSVEVRVGDRSCRVSVENIDRGRVALGYVCG